MKSLVKQIFLVMCLILFTIVSSAAALELTDAKNQGLVGETTSGYLAAVSEKPGASVRALVEEVNAKRRLEYLKIAQKNKTEVGAVEALAGKNFIERTPSGQFVQIRPGVWEKK